MLIRRFRCGETDRRRFDVNECDVSLCVEDPSQSARLSQREPVMNPLN